MKYKIFLLLFSFTASTFIAIPPTLGMDTPQSYPKNNTKGFVEPYVSRNMVNNPRTEEANQRPQMVLRASGIGRGVDPTLIHEGEELSLNSSIDFIKQQTQKAKNVTQKWSDQLKQQIDIDEVTKEYLEEVISAATCDIEYWTIQQSEISLLLEKKSPEEKKNYLTNDDTLEGLSQEASRAMNSARQVIEYYLILCEGLEKKRSNEKTEFFNMRNSSVSLFSYQYAPEVENLLLKGENQSNDKPENFPKNTSSNSIKFTNSNGALTAKTREEILENWDPKAEIKYNPAKKEYISDKVEPEGFIATVIQACSRSLTERYQHQQAIEHIALSYGTDRAFRFQSHFSVRVRNIVGSPLTPELINKVEEDLNKEDLAQQRASILGNSLSSWRNMLETNFARFNLRWRERKNPYTRIPDQE